MSTASVNSHTSSSPPSPPPTPRYSRLNRLSGPPTMGIAIPVIKTEKEQFEMSPLRDDCFNIAELQSDQHKYLTDTDNNIKIEPDMDCLDFCLNEGLEGIMGNYSFENEADVKPDIKSHEKDFSPTSPTTPLPVSTARNVMSQQQQPPAIPTGERGHNTTQITIHGHQQWQSNIYNLLLVLVLLSEV